MAEPLQFAQQLAHQTSAATNQYRAQGADIGGPIARGLSAGVDIGMDFERFELQQATAEAQAQENAIRVQNLMVEHGIRQQAATTRTMELQERMMRNELEAQDKAAGRELERERLKRDALEAKPLPLPNGRYLISTVGAGGVQTSFEAGADHPVVQAAYPDKGAGTDRLNQLRYGAEDLRQQAAKLQDTDPTRAAELIAQADEYQSEHADAMKPARKVGREAAQRAYRDVEGRARGFFGGNGSSNGSNGTASTPTKDLMRGAVGLASTGLAKELGIAAEKIAPAVFSMAKVFHAAGETGTEEELAGRIMATLKHPETTPEEREQLLDMLRSMIR